MRAGEPGQFGFLKIDKMIDELIIRKTKQIVNLLNNLKIKKFFFFKSFKYFVYFQLGVFFSFLSTENGEKNKQKTNQTKDKWNRNT